MGADRSAGAAAFAHVNHYSEVSSQYQFANYTRHMTPQMVCANIGLMSEVQDRLLSEVGELATALVKAEEVVAEIRAQLHAKIREAGDPALGTDKTGPSAIARATGHRYTREYVGSLLKS